MTIKNALYNILEGNLDEMRQNFSSALTTKAVEKLEERKIEIAQNYFGQIMEKAEQVDEPVPIQYAMRPLPPKTLPKFDDVVDKAVKSAKAKQKTVAVKKKK